MKIIIDEKNQKELLHCIYIGTYVMNNGLKDEGKNYGDFAEDIYKQVLWARGMSGNDRQISELRDRVLDEISEAFETYENQIFYERLTDEYIKRRKREDEEIHERNS